MDQNPEITWSTPLMQRRLWKNQHLCTREALSVWGTKGWDGRAAKAVTHPCPAAWQSASHGIEGKISCPLSPLPPLLFNIMLKDFTRKRRQMKKLTGTWVGKEDVVRETIPYTILPPPRPLQSPKEVKNLSNEIVKTLKAAGWKFLPYLTHWKN